MLCIVNVALEHGSCELFGCQHEVDGRLFVSLFATSSYLEEVETVMRAHSSDRQWRLPPLDESVRCRPLLKVDHAD